MGDIDLTRGEEFNAEIGERAWKRRWKSGSQVETSINSDSESADENAPEGTVAARQVHHGGFRQGARV